MAAVAGLSWLSMKAIVLLAAIGGLALLARRFGPQMRARCMAAIEHMFDEMPEAFPPKRIISNLEVLRTQSERIIALLEGQGRASEQAPAA